MPGTEAASACPELRSHPEFQNDRGGRGQSTRVPRILLMCVAFVPLETCSKVDSEFRDGFVGTWNCSLSSVYDYDF